MSIHQKYKYVCLSPASTNLAMTDFRASGDDYNHLNVQFFFEILVKLLGKQISMTILHNLV